jgi:hypothetical protein
MTRTLLIFALLFTQACGSGSDEEPDAGNPTKDVASVNMEAIVVLAGGGSLQLFDPSTGLPSPIYAANPATNFSSVAVSPDGTRLAYTVADGVELAEVNIEASGPTMTSVSKWSLEELNLTRPVVRLLWSPDGERLVYDTGAIDVASGEVYACDEPVLPGQPASAVAGGHDIICRSSLLRDDLPLAEEVGLLSADGQFGGFNVHLPSGALRSSIESLGGLTYEDLTPLGSGDYGRFLGSVHGTFVVAEDAGFVTVFRKVTDTTPPRDGETYAPFDTFTAGPALTPKEWATSDALMAYFDEGDGRRYSFVGTTADGNDALYRINSHVIEPDRLTNVLNEIPVQAALVAISKTGDVRAMRTRDLGLLRIDSPFRTAYQQRTSQPNVLDPLGLVDLGEGNLVMPSGSTDIDNATSWVGWIDGKPWAGGDALGIISPDGRWLAGTRSISSGEAPAICFTEVKSGAAKQCIVPTTAVIANEVNAFVYGTKREFDTEPPRLLATSRTAAWEGSPVILHGLRFGTAGKVSVGGVQVPESAITEWSDHRITFTMDPSLPQNGKIEVEAATGTSAAGRVFWIHRTSAATTPFDNVPINRVSLGQGINSVDLGDLAGFEDIVGNADPIRLTEDLLLADGHYAVLTEGAGEPTDGSSKLVIGDFSRPFFYRLENRLVSDNGWALASRLDNFTPGRASSFTHIANDLVVLGLGGQHLFIDGERLAFANPSDRNPGTISAYWGIPDFWRELPNGTGAWVFVKFNNYQYELRMQTGWYQDLMSYLPVHADAPKLIIPGMAAVEAAGDVVLATGTAETGAGFALSTDGGISFAPSVSVGAADKRYREPIRIDAAAGTFFLVMESPTNGPGLDGVHAISLDGVFTPSIAAIPPGQLDGGLALSPLPVQHKVRGGEVVLYFPMTKTLVRTDFDATPTGATWEILPSAAHAGKVESFYQQEGSDELVAVLDDGSVLNAEADWSSWSPLELAIELPLPTRVKPVSLGRLPDGRWLIHAALYDASPGAAMDTPSPISPSGFFLSTTP